MKVARWGNSLAVRLPAEVVEKLGIKAGDELHAMFDEHGRLNVERKPSREERWQRLWDRVDADPVKLPSGYRFSRAEIYDE